MPLPFAKWGNRLSLHNPAQFVRWVDVKEGDTAEVTMAAGASLSVRWSKWDRKEFAKQLERIQESMPMGESVVEELRRGARF
jgi:antitoxin MazE